MEHSNEIKVLGVGSGGQLFKADYILTLSVTGLGALYELLVMVDTSVLVGAQVKDYDAVSRIDQWLTAQLLHIKKSIGRVPDIN